MSDLKFTFNLDKLINAIAYFSSESVPGLTKLKVAKLLYFADKDHLLRYGRPIIGDEYFCLPYGPVPSVSLNEMNDALNSSSLEKGDGTRADSACFAISLKVSKPFFGHPVFKARNGYDAQVFSKSELDSLARTVSQFGRKSASDLVTLTHKEVAWMIPNKSRPSGGRARIPYDLFFHDAGDEALELLSFIREEQRERCEFEAFMRSSLLKGERADAEHTVSRNALQESL